MASGSYGQIATLGSAVGVYRFLGGNGYQPKSYPAAPAFGDHIPLAIAPSSYNRTEATTDTHVAYGSNMSEWCANCHDQFLNVSSTLGTPGHPHPAGQAIDTTVMNNYNAYIMTGNMSGGAAAGYWSLVPVEQGVTDYNALATSGSATNGTSTYTTVDTNAKVMCLSCHRAHASAFNSMIRWYNSDSFVTEDSAYYTNANGSAPNTTAQASKAYYDRLPSKFAPYQRVLCNKCHAKD